jgi:hypothetical protein
MKLLALLLALFFSSLAFAAPPTFDQNKAIQKAGSLVDSSKTMFQIFYIPANSPIDSTVSKLTQYLQNSAAIQASLGILGPDYNLNYQLIKAALAASPKESLEGIQIIYIGNSEHFEEIGRLAASTGAKLSTSTCCD